MADEVQSELHDKGRELDRLKALSDGVFAIVLTLLVLELRVPELDTGSEGGLVSELARLSPKFVSYLMSFFVIGLYWIVHNRIVRHLTGYDRGILWLNLLFLLFVSLLPFFTSVSGEYPTLALAWQVYACNVFLVGLSATLLWNISRKKGYVDESVSGRLASYIAARGFATALVFLASAPVALANVWMARAMPVLIPLTLMFVHKKYEKS